MLRKIFQRKNLPEWIGEEWMTLRDRLLVPDYYEPNESAQGGEVEIIEERCDACGLCVRICPADTLRLAPRSTPVQKGKRTITKVMAMNEEPECVACGCCGAICPNYACYVSKPMRMDNSIFKTINKGPLAMPRLFNED